MAIRAPDGAKNSHTLPTGQWYALSAVINDALIMPEYARACQSMQKYARVCESMQEYARVCQSVPEYARVLPSFAKIVPKSSPSHPQVVPR